MDLTEYVETRRKRYLARTLESFELTVAPALEAGDGERAAEAVEAWKASVRVNFQDFADDLNDIMRSLDIKVAFNDFAVALRDRLADLSNGRRHPRRQGEPVA